MADSVNHRADEQARALDRAEIIRLARKRSRRPDHLYPADDLKRIFAGYEQDLEELTAQIDAANRAARAERDAHTARRQNRHYVKQRTDRILAEWDEERRRKAEDLALEQLDLTREDI